MWFLAFLFILSFFFSCLFPDLLFPGFGFIFVNLYPFRIQVRLKREHLNIAKFEPDNGLDPMLDLALVGSEWQFRIQSRASKWQDNLVVTSTRSVEQDVLSPTEVTIVVPIGSSVSGSLCLL